MASKESPLLRLARSMKASRMATRPRWVMAPYHWPAARTAGLSRCSASTSRSDESAISSHRKRNVDALPADGTMSKVQTNRGKPAWTDRLSR